MLVPELLECQYLSAAKVHTSCGVVEVHGVPGSEPLPAVPLEIGAPTAGVFDVDG